MIRERHHASIIQPRPTTIVMNTASACPDRAVFHSMSTADRQHYADEDVQDAPSGRQSCRDDGADDVITPETTK